MGDIDVSPYHGAGWDIIKGLQNAVPRYQRAQRPLKPNFDHLTILPLVIHASEHNVSSSSEFYSRKISLSEVAYSFPKAWNFVTF